MTQAAYKWEGASGVGFSLGEAVVEGKLTLFSHVTYDADLYVVGPKELVQELERRAEVLNKELNEDDTGDVEFDLERLVREINAEQG